MLIKKINFNWISKNKIIMSIFIFILLILNLPVFYYIGETSRGNLEAKRYSLDIFMNLNLIRMMLTKEPLIIFMSIISLIGILIFKKNRDKNLFFVLWFLSFLIPFLFFLETRERYCLVLLFPIYFIFSESCYNIFNYINKEREKFFVLILMLIFLIFFIFNEEKYTFNENSKYGQTKIIDKIREYPSNSSIFFTSYYGLYNLNEFELGNYTHYHVLSLNELKKIEKKFNKQIYFLDINAGKRLNLKNYFSLEESIFKDSPYEIKIYKMKKSIND